MENENWPIRTTNTALHLSVKVSKAQTQLQTPHPLPFNFTCWFLVQVYCPSVYLHIFFCLIYVKWFDMCYLVAL